MSLVSCLGLGLAWIWRGELTDNLETPYFALRQSWELGPGRRPEPLPNERFEVQVSIDSALDRHRIAPEIYGMAAAPAGYLADLRLGCNRWGGNQTSRYNWVHGNATSAARDWHWANRPMTEGVPAGSSSAADEFVRRNRAHRVSTLLAIPNLGWVARDAKRDTRSREVPRQGGPPRDDRGGEIVGYSPVANRLRTSLPAFPRKAGPFSLSPPADSQAIYQDEWVYHLVRTFGTAAGGGVRLYAMDNEPDLWDITHTDVQPVQQGYDELCTRFLAYASAVKSVDPSAQVTGPVASGWTGYLYSPRDRGIDNFRSHRERNNHGSEPFLLWFLKQVRAHDQRIGRRTLDILDVHYYPQAEGVFSASTDTATQARRLRATRALWDPSYVDESWIRRPIRLLPRLRDWIEAGYPGTRIGITEWNFGAERHISGGLAVAETLGIFGREDVALANYWAYPPRNSPAYLAFKLFRNADGHGRGFGDVSCRAISSDPGRVSCFAAVDSATETLTFCLINKTAGIASVPVSLGCTAPETPECLLWRLSAARDGEIVTERPQRGLSFTLPPSSITLVHLPRSY